MIEFNDNTDILFIKSKGSVNTFVMSTYHSIVRDTVDNYVVEQQARRPMNTKYRMNQHIDRIMLEDLLANIQGKIPNVRFITKIDDEIVEITDRNKILDKLWNRVLLRSQLFRRLQLKEEKRQMELRMSVQNQLMSSTSQPLTSLPLDPFKIQQCQPPLIDTNNIIIANNEILQDPSSEPITKKCKKKAGLLRFKKGKKNTTGVRAKPNLQKKKNASTSEQTA